MRLSLIILCALNAISAAHLASGLFKRQQGGLQLDWLVQDKMVTFTLRANATGYAAIGFGSSMMQTDMVICWVDAAGTAHAVDSFASGHKAPMPDVSLNGTNDITILSGSINNGVMEVAFRRPLHTNDTHDTDIKVADAMDVVFAWRNGPAGELVYHGHNHAHFMLNLSKADGMPEGEFGDEQRGVGARALVQLAYDATLATLNIADGAGGAQMAGYPYASVAGFADYGDGRPVLLLSLLERNIINQEADQRCSLETHYPEELANGTDAMAAPRVTLMGSLRRVPDEDRANARNKYVAKHPMADMWADFADFAFYFFEPRDVYWVGGFGGSHYIGWIPPSDYLQASPKAMMNLAPPLASDFAEEAMLVV